MTTTTIKLKIPFPICDEGDYNVSLDGKVAVIRVKHLQNHGSLELVLGLKVSGSGKTSLSQDHYGIANISDIEIIFPYLISTADKRKTEYECIRYLNRLVEIVKLYTHQYWLRTISSREIFVSNIDQSDEDGKPPKSVVMISFGGSSESISIPIRTQQDCKTTIEDALKDERPVPTWMSLQLDATNYYSMGLYNESIIAQNIALEIFTIEKIYKKLIEIHTDPKKAKEILDKITDARFRKVLDTQLKSIMNKSLKDTEYWEDFIKVREQRASVVHPYHTMIEKEDCMRSFTTIGKVMEWVDTVCSPDKISQSKDSTNI